MPNRFIQEGKKCFRVLRGFALLSPLVTGLSATQVYREWDVT